MQKKNLLVSFSGGETSAFMAQWLWKNKQDEYNMVFVFANTGEENIETIRFCQNCENHFGFKVHYIEAVVNSTFGIGNTYVEKEIFELSMNGEPFESVISKHGIPNVNYPHCTRELKERPIKKFGQDYFGTNDFYTAIGIRTDEFDRQNSKKDEMKLIYPLLKMRPMDKPRINFFWKLQPFRLNLKGYEGNCKTCWKKADPKLLQIAKEAPNKFGFMAKMEDNYGNYVPLHRLENMKEKGIEIELPIRFFRKNKTTNDFLVGAKRFNKKIKDDSQNYNFQSDLFEDNSDLQNESCEIFSECRQ